MTSEIKKFKENEKDLRISPSNVEAEQALLAAILTSNSVYEHISDFLRPEHFYDDINGKIFEATAKLLEKNQLAYVPPLWLHRSVNIGDYEFVTLFTYNSDAGQNYEILKKSGGMRKRVVQKDNNSWTLVANTRFSLSS